MTATQRRVFTAILTLALLPPAAQPHGTGGIRTDSTALRRLSLLCRLWGSLKYLHPFLAYKSINWDSAFAASASAAAAAAGPDEYRAALQVLLDPLGDSATRISGSGRARSSGGTPSLPRFHFSTDSVLVIVIDDYPVLEYGSNDPSSRELNRAAEMMPASHGVVFDLRTPAALAPEEAGNLEYAFSETDIASHLSTRALTVPGERRRIHRGLAPNDGKTSGGYVSAFSTSDGSIIPPGKDGHAGSTVFLINANSELPSAALGLQSAGEGVIVAEGSVSEYSVVQTQPFDAGEGITVEYRLGELMYADGSTGLRVDSVVTGTTARGEDRAMDAALSLARGVVPRTGTPRRAPAVAFPVHDNPYPTPLYPSLPYRLLAAARIWAAIAYFFPYKELMHENWDAVLEERLPDFILAKDSLEYALAVAAMVTRVHDSHAFMTGKVIGEYMGVAPTPVVVRLVEGLPVITSFADDSAAANSGAKIGDVVISVDGESAAARIARLSRYVAASTRQALERVVCSRLLSGPDSSRAIVVVRGRDDARRTLNLRRLKSYRASGQRSGDILRMLPGNIGYADLDRLPVSMVDSMFEAFRNTRGIIFDMRGYPRGTAWHIAPRLTERFNVAAALFSRPTVTYPEGPSESTLWERETHSFVQSLPSTDKWRYRGKTVMLIDERTQSQAEHTGLFFRAANGTTFIGSGTAGADGDVTNFVVPGGMTIWFSGHAVSFPDGRQLQRIGLVPDIEARPTIAGIRLGKDEVLDRAIDFMKKIPK